MFDYQLIERDMVYDIIRHHITPSYLGDMLEQLDNKSSYNESDNTFYVWGEVHNFYAATEIVFNNCSDETAADIYNQVVSESSCEYDMSSGDYRVFKEEIEDE